MYVFVEVVHESYMKHVRLMYVLYNTYMVLKFLKLNSLYP